MGVLQSENMTDEQRVITARVPGDHFGRKRCVGVGQKRRIAGIFVFHVQPFDRSPGKVTDQLLLSARQNADAEMVGFEKERMHARF